LGIAELKVILIDLDLRKRNGEKVIGNCIEQVALAEREKLMKRFLCKAVLSEFPIS